MSVQNGSTRSYMRAIFRRCNVGALFLSWGIFICSFALPATSALEMSGKPLGAPLSGWETLMSLAVVANPFVVLGEPRLLVWAAIALVVNIAMTLSVIVYYILDDGAYIIAPVFFVGAIVAITLPNKVTGTVYIGFYMWVASMILTGVCFCIKGYVEEDESDMKTVVH